MFTDEHSPFRPRSDSSWPIAAVVLAVFAAFGLYTYIARVNAHDDAARATPRPVAVRPEPSATGPTVTPRHESSPVYPGLDSVRSAQPSNAVNPNARTTIYLCRSYSGGTFWSDTTCGMQRATIDRMTGVPASLPFDAQVAIARGEAQEAARLYEAPQPAWAAAMESPAPARARPAICVVYDQQVRDLDAEARRPLPAFRQDQIRLHRMNVMATRARERC